MVSSTPRPHFTPGKDPVPNFTGGWVGPRAGLGGRKISSPPGLFLLIYNKVKYVQLRFQPLTHPTNTVPWFNIGEPIRSRTVQPVAQSLYRLSYPSHVLARILVLLRDCISVHKSLFKCRFHTHEESGLF